MGRHAVRRDDAIACVISRISMELHGGPSGQPGDFMVISRALVR
jgi:hypothetical protein